MFGLGRRRSKSPEKPVISKPMSVPVPTSILNQTRGAGLEDSKVKTSGDDVQAPPRTSSLRASADGKLSNNAVPESQQLSASTSTASSGFNPHLLPFLPGQDTTAPKVKFLRRMPSAQKLRGEDAPAQNANQPFAWSSLGSPSPEFGNNLSLGPPQIFGPSTHSGLDSSTSLRDTYMGHFTSQARPHPASNDNSSPRSGIPISITPTSGPDSGKNAPSYGVKEEVHEWEKHRVAGNAFAQGNFSRPWKHDSTDRSRETSQSVGSSLSKNDELSTAGNNRPNLVETAGRTKPNPLNLERAVPPSRLQRIEVLHKNAAIRGDAVALRNLQISTHAMLGQSYSGNDQDTDPRKKTDIEFEDRKEVKLPQFGTPHRKAIRSDGHVRQVSQDTPPKALQLLGLSRDDITPSKVARVLGTESIKITPIDTKVLNDASPFVADAGKSGRTKRDSPSKIPTPKVTTYQESPSPTRTSRRTLALKVSTTNIDASAKAKQRLGIVQGVLDRKQSLRYLDDTTPPTPPEKDTIYVAREKGKSAVVRKPKTGAGSPAKPHVGTIFQSTSRSGASGPKKKDTKAALKSSESRHLLGTTNVIHKPSIRSMYGVIEGQPSIRRALATTASDKELSSSVSLSKDGPAVAAIREQLRQRREEIAPPGHIKTAKGSHISHENPYSPSVYSPYPEIAPLEEPSMTNPNDMDSEDLTTPASCPRQSVDETAKDRSPDSYLTEENDSDHHSSAVPTPLYGRNAKLTPLAASKVNESTLSDTPSNLLQGTPPAFLTSPVGFTASGLPIIPPEDFISHFDLTNHNIYTSALRVRDHIDAAKMETISQIRKAHAASIRKLNSQFSLLHETLERHDAKLERVADDCKSAKHQVQEIAETLQKEFIARLDQALFQNSELAAAIVGRVGRMESEMRMVLSQVQLAAAGLMTQNSQAVGLCQDENAARMDNICCSSPKHANYNVFANGQVYTHPSQRQHYSVHRSYGLVAKPNGNGDGPEIGENAS